MYCNYNILLRYCCTVKLTWEQVWHIGESTCHPPMWPGFNSWHQHHTLYVGKFVLGSLLCSGRSFSRYLLHGFPWPLLKNQHRQIPIWPGMVDQDQLYSFHFNNNEEDKEKGFRWKEYPSSTATTVLKREPNLKWFFAVISYSKVICLVLSIIIIG